MVVKKMEFGFDIGISNIGWAVFDEENNQFIDSGVRKFSIPENPKTKEPLSRARGEARRRRKTLSRKKYRENILNVISKVFVSHKVEGRIRGELHNQTIYSKKNLSGKEQEAINSGKKILIRGGFADNANGSMKRLDIFRDKQTGRYYGCPIYSLDYANKKLPNRVFIGGGKQQDINDNLEFCFSLTRNNLAHQ